MSSKKDDEPDFESFAQRRRTPFAKRVLIHESTPTTDDEPRPRGRPMVGALSGTGGFKRVNLSLDEGSLEVAARIHSNTSAAIRMALAYWAEHNPPPRKPRAQKKR